MGSSLVQHARRNKKFKALAAVALAASLVVAPLVTAGASAADLIGVEGSMEPATSAANSTKYWEDPEREAMVKRSLQSWRVDAPLMASTNQALLMHPLPVRRNVVATDEVLDGPRSVIYDQAANRTHVQKALLMQLLKQGPA